MNFSTLRSVALAAILAGSSFAANIAGTWQGTLTVQGPQGKIDLRAVFKVSLDDDKYKANFYSIDQNPTPIPVSSISLSGETVKMAIAPIGGTFEGKLSTDGNTITGTFSQGAPLPLVLTKATPATEWTIPEPPPPPKQMAEDAKPTFEVATIKPAKAGEFFSLLVNPRNGMMTTTNTSLADLIKFAYDLHPKQIVAEASWMENDKYDITGKPDTPGSPNIPQLKMMLRQLLADRFQLKFHKEQKELSVYAITVAKTGVKMTKNDSKGLPGYGGGGVRGMVVRNSTIADWAAIMQAGVLDKPVVDQTGLGSQHWDFILKWTPDPALAPPGAQPPPPPAAGGPDAPPDLFLAVQQQLGLKLESTKAPVDVLIIDKAEKPSEN